MCVCVLCVQELNVFGPNNTPSADLRLDLPPELAIQVVPLLFLGLLDIQFVLGARQEAQAAATAAAH